MVNTGARRGPTLETVRDVGREQKQNEPARRRGGGGGQARTRAQTPRGAVGLPSGPLATGFFFSPPLYYRTKLEHRLRGSSGPFGRGRPLGRTAAKAREWGGGSGKRNGAQGGSGSGEREGGTGRAPSPGPASPAGRGPGLRDLPPRPDAPQGPVGTGENRIQPLQRHVSCAGTA